MARDTERAMKAYEAQTARIAAGYADTANKVMKEVYACDPECTDRFTQQVFFNPSEAVQRCKCKIPISMDMSSQYLFRSPDIELYSLMRVDTADY